MDSLSAIAISLERVIEYCHPRLVECTLNFSQTFRIPRFSGFKYSSVQYTDAGAPTVQKNQGRRLPHSIKVYRASAQSTIECPPVSCQQGRDPILFGVLAYVAGFSVVTGHILLLPVTRVSTSVSAGSKSLPLRVGGAPLCTRLAVRRPVHHPCLRKSASRRSACLSCPGNLLLFPAGSGKIVSYQS